MGIAIQEYIKSRAKVYRIIKEREEKDLKEKWENTIDITSKKDIDYLFIFSNDDEQDTLGILKKVIIKNGNKKYYINEDGKWFSKIRNVKLSDKVIDEL